MTYTSTKIKDKRSLLIFREAKTLKGKNKG